MREGRKERMIERREEGRRKEGANNEPLIQISFNKHTYEIVQSNLQKQITMPAVQSYSYLN